MSEPNPSTTRGVHHVGLTVHHVGLTVPRLEETRRFFLDTLGYRQVGEVADYPAVFLSDGRVMLTLWQAEDGDAAVPRHLMCAIPGGVRVEFIAPAS